MKDHSLQIQVLYEIAMSIGNEPNLFEMLQNSLSVVLRNLNCSAGGILECTTNTQNEYGVQPIFSIPRRADDLTAYQSALQKISYQSDFSETAAFINRLPYVESVDGRSFFHIMELPDFGLLILIKANIPLEQQLLYSLKPIAKKMAGACISCRQNEEMVQLVNQLKIENQERRKVENALKASYELFKTVMDSIDATIYVADMDTYEIIFTNKHMKKSFDKQLEGGICYREFRNETHPCDHCSNAKLVDKSGKSIGVYTWEGQNPVNSKWYLNFDRAIKWIDGRMVRLQIATDITDLKNMESELRQIHKMESIGTIAGGIAHDFNNLLYMIVGNTELALEDIPSGNPAHANLEEIKSASLRAAAIVKQLLNFSRKTDQALKPINAVTVIKDALKFLKSLIPSTIEIRKQIPSDDIIIIGDPIQINQIMMNLCTNATQAMEEMGGVLEINVETVSLDEASLYDYPNLPAGDYIKIMVKDTGFGIPANIINRIFDPYFTTKEMGKGSGMGLAVVHGIVKNHNGAIFVESQSGEGTTFTLLFPVIDEKLDIEIKTIDRLLYGTESILFVDDEQVITKIAQKVLKKLGYTVEACLNPMKALEIFQSKPDFFDLVITDMTMPQMTGAKLSEKLKEIRPDIPVVICTGHSALIDEEKAKSLGIAGYIMKPVPMSEMAKTIREVLDKNL